MGHNCLRTGLARKSRCSLFAVLIVMLLIFCFGIMAGCGCRHTRYSGVVLDADTKLPIGGAEVDGQYEINKRFAPTLDGLFEREVKHIKTVTDTEGKFVIELPGFNHILYFDAKGHRSAVFNMDKQREGMVVRLKEGHGQEAVTPYP